MIKVFFTGILLLVLLPAEWSIAQEPLGHVKIFSGYLHKHAARGKTSLWHALFGPKSSRQEQVDQNRGCSIEFLNPDGFSHEPSDVIPRQLSYLIKFKNAGFDKFTIKIYTNDGDDYSIDPNAEGGQVGINDEHHVFDSYTIYLILGTDINHLEIVTPAGDEGDKYVLDKLEIR